MEKIESSSVTAADFEEQQIALKKKKEGPSFSVDFPSFTEDSAATNEKDESIEDIAETTVSHDGRQLNDASHRRIKSENQTPRCTGSEEQLQKEEATVVVGGTESPPSLDAQQQQSSRQSSQSLTKPQQQALKQDEDGEGTVLCTAASSSSAESLYDGLDLDQVVDMVGEPEGLPPDVFVRAPIYIDGKLVSPPLTISNLSLVNNHNTVLVKASFDESGNIIIPPSSSSSNSSFSVTPSATDGDNYHRSSKVEERGSGGGGVAAAEQEEDLHRCRSCQSCVGESRNRRKLPAEMRKSRSCDETRKQCWPEVKYSPNKSRHGAKDAKKLK